MFSTETVANHLYAGRTRDYMGKRGSILPETQVGAMERDPIITLTTDFGTRDGYVGAMVGVIVRQCPKARIFSITHDVDPQDILGGAWALRNAWRWFPPGTIHVAVIDPRVGTDRRGVLVRADGHTFVGPDNGLIPGAVADTMIDAARIIDNPDARAPETSATFHGRDVFAWAAGWLASGHEWPAVGQPIQPSDLVRPPDETPRVRKDQRATSIQGRALIADRFGNLITSIYGRLITESKDLGGTPEVRVDGIPVQFGRTFGDVDEGDAIAYIGSSGQLEIGINGGSAANVYGKSASVVVSVPA